MIPWLIVAEIVSATGKSLAALVREMEERYPVSGEINLPRGTWRACSGRRKKNTVPKPKRFLIWTA